MKINQLGTIHTALSYVGRIAVIVGRYASLEDVAATESYIRRTKHVDGLSKGGIGNGRGRFDGVGTEVQLQIRNIAEGICPIHQAHCTPASNTI